MINDKIIPGTEIAAQMLQQIADEVTTLKEVPGIAFICVGHDPGSKIYVARKAKAAALLGIKSFTYQFEQNASRQHILQEIASLNARTDVHGILVQLPLPGHLNAWELTNAISPLKDVDGFTIENVGRLVTNQDGLVPCTPQGCLALIKHACPTPAGLHAAVIGRSSVVGRPMAELLLHENCTVTIMHSHSIDAPKIARQADILIAAVGKAHFINEDWVKEGAIVIDVGITRLADGISSTKLVGDVDFKNLLSKVKAITPVPGGVGPMTVAYLMKNTLKALKLQQRY